LAWDWPELKTQDSAKTAVVGVVGLSALYALLPLMWLPQAWEISPPGQRGGLWVTLADSVLFAVTGWGIYRMSRIAAIAGAVAWFVRIALQFQKLVILLLPYTYSFTAKFIFLHPLVPTFLVLKLLVLLLYIIAVRATFVYHDLERDGAAVADGPLV
jgi:hypothetical protein